MRFILLFLVSSILFTSCQDSTEKQDFQTFVDQNGPEVDLWITNGQVYSGLQSPLENTNLLIKNGSIVYKGWVDSTIVQAREVINADKAVVSPGFIDPHAHGDPMRTPDFNNFLAMGVTTIFLGQDGSSPSSDPLAQWMEKADSLDLGVNIATFVGHGTLRRLSGINYDSVPSPEGMQKMKQLLTQGLQDGAYGMSMGLEYNPGGFAKIEELNQLAQIVGQYDGLITSHVRNEDDDAVAASIKELIAQAEFCPVNVSHMKSVYGKGTERAEELLQLLHTPANYPITADVYPYTASFTGIGIVFPDWAKGPNNYDQVKRTRRQELLDFLHNKVIARNGPEATLLGTGDYRGKTLAQLSEEQNRPFEEILLDIGPRGASGAYFVMDEALQNRLIQDSLVMICSDGSPTMNHPRGYGSFAKIIEEMVVRDSLLTLNEAIYKMSTQTSRVYGLSERGELSVGKKADIVIFRPEEVKAKADFTEPHQLAIGFQYVLVNGAVAMEGEVKKGVGHGEMLRKPY
jgi:N-acyl-D-aspartate/D-glutamate deacylase